MKPLLFLIVFIIIFSSCNSKLKEQNAKLQNKLDSTAIVAVINMNLFMQKEILARKMVATQQTRADSLQALLDKCRANKK